MPFFVAGPWNVLWPSVVAQILIGLPRPSEFASDTIQGATRNRLDLSFFLLTLQIA